MNTGNSYLQNTHLAEELNQLYNVYSPIVTDKSTLQHLQPSILRTGHDHTWHNT